MSTMAAVILDDESTAFEMRGALVKMQKQFLLDMDDAVVVTRDPSGKTKLHQPVSLRQRGRQAEASGGCSFSTRCSGPRLVQGLAF